MWIVCQNLCMSLLLIHLNHQYRFVKITWVIQLIFYLCLQSCRNGPIVKNHGRWSQEHPTQKSLVRQECFHHHPPACGALARNRTGQFWPTTKQRRTILTRQKSMWVSSLSLCLSLSVSLSLSLSLSVSLSLSLSLCLYLSIVRIMIDPFSVADPGFSKWGGAVLSQMGGRTSCFQVKSAWNWKK